MLARVDIRAKSKIAVIDRVYDGGIPVQHGGTEDGAQ